MAYLAPGDFRPASLTWYTRSIPLSTAEAPDPDLTSAIAAMSDRFDALTDDHFEAENGLAVKVSGQGTSRLYLPKRVRSVTSVQTLNADGTTYTTQPATAYTVISSLNAAGDTRLKEMGDGDYIVVQPGQFLTGLGYWYDMGGTYYLDAALPGDLSDGSTWPIGAANVTVTGNFSWTVVPERVKRAVALMVWDVLKPMNDQLQRSTRWNSSDATYDMAQTQPTGIPEADEIIAYYSRPSLLAV